MRILLIVVYYPPSTTSAARMMQDLAREYARLGHDVTVATPCDSADEKTNITREGGVTVVRVQAGNMKYAHKAVRMFRETRISQRIWRGARKYFEENRCELIIFYSPTNFFRSLGATIEVDVAMLFLSDFAGHFSSMGTYTGMLHEGSALSLLEAQGVEQYAAADVIGVESFGNLSYFEREPHRFNRSPARRRATAAKRSNRRPTAPCRRRRRATRATGARSPSHCRRPARRPTISRRSSWRRRSTRRPTTGPARGPPAEA